MIKKYKEITAEEISINMIRAGITAKQLREKYSEYKSTSIITEARKGRFPGLKIRIIDDVKAELALQNKKWIKL